mgnify:CR=1 FL=1
MPMKFTLEFSFALISLRSFDPALNCYKYYEVLQCQVLIKANLTFVEESHRVIFQTLLRRVYGNEVRFRDKGLESTDL